MKSRLNRVVANAGRQGAKCFVKVGISAGQHSLLHLLGLKLGNLRLSARGRGPCHTHIYIYIVNNSSVYDMKYYTVYGI